MSTVYKRTYYKYNSYTIMVLEYVLEYRVPLEYTCTTMVLDYSVPVYYI